MLDKGYNILPAAVGRPQLKRGDNMASIIEVNTGTLKIDINDLQGEIGALRHEIQRLREEAASLGNTWEGEAKAAFMGALADDIGKLEMLIADIEKYTRQTDNARNEYEKCENSVAQLISAIRV